jgi:uncharacterized protein (DUF58 family)
MTDALDLPFPRSFLGRLAAVKGLAGALFRGSAPATAASGLPVEFDRHRAYEPGDDPRWIDWNIFARLDQLTVKVFQVEEEIDILVLLDASASMGLGGGPKQRTAAAAAVATAYLGFLNAHPVTVGRYAQRLLELRGPRRHPRDFPELARVLVESRPDGGTDLGAGLAFLAASRRPVTVAVVTDGLQREPLARVARAVVGQGHRLLVLLVEDRRDREPRLRGNVVLQDPEGGEAIRLWADGELEEQLRRRIRLHFEGLARDLAALGAPLLRLKADSPFESAFLAALKRAADAPAIATAP